MAAPAICRRFRRHVRSHGELSRLSARRARNRGRRASRWARGSTIKSSHSARELEQKRRRALDGRIGVEFLTRDYERGRRRSPDPGHDAECVLRRSCTKSSTFGGTGCCLAAAIEHTSYDASFDGRPGRSRRSTGASGSVGAARGPRRSNVALVVNVIGRVPCAGARRAVQLRTASRQPGVRDRQSRPGDRTDARAWTRAFAAGPRASAANSTCFFYDISQLRLPRLHRRDRGRAACRQLRAGRQPLHRRRGGRSLSICSPYGS